MGLFGPTKKGGGLDRRFSSNKGGYLGKASRFASSLGGDDDDDYEYGGDYVPEVSQNTRVDNSDVDSLCNSLDEIISEGASNIFSGNSQSRSKLRRGVLELKKMGAPDLAMHYNSELKRLSRKRNAVLFLIVIAILGSFGGLVFFAFFYEQ